MLETRMHIIVKIPEGYETADIRVSVHQWKDDELFRNSTPFTGTMPVKAIDSQESVIPWTISTARHVADVVVADLIHRLSEGEEIMMHDCVEHQLK